MVVLLCCFYLLHRYAFVIVALRCYTVPFTLLFCCDLIVKWIGVELSTSSKKLVVDVLHTVDNGFVDTLFLVVALLCCLLICITKPFLSQSLLL